MSSITERAVELKAKGFNCAQAVAVAFAKTAGYSEDEIAKISVGFGAGGGDMQGTCGAVAATQMLMGMILKNKYSDINELKRKVMSANREIAKKFRDKNKSTICKELKGLDTGVILRDCSGCVEDAATFLEEYLKENKIID